MLAKLINPRSIAFSLCLFLAAVCCFLWADFPALDSAPVQRIAIFSTLGFSMLGLVFFFPPISKRNSFWLIFGAAILLRALLWNAPVSDDVNRYLWEGLVVADGENPYAAVAEDPRWEDRRDQYWEAMNHRDRPTAYPPGIQWLMGATAWISPNLLSFKVLALIGDSLCLWLLFLLMETFRAPLRWLGFYAFNPIVLISFSAEAHFDSLMIAGVLAAIFFAKRRPALAWVSLAFAIQIKIVALVLTPLFLGKKLWKSAWILPLLLVLPGLPFLAELPAWLEGIRVFAGESAFSAPLYSLLSYAGLQPSSTRLFCSAAFIICAAIISAYRWRGAPLIDSCLLMFGALLICSPIVHFWYIAWLIPLIAIRPSFAWATLSICIGGYFLAWKTQNELGWWGYGHGTALLIWLPWLVAAVMQNRFFFQKMRAKKLSDSPFEMAVVIPVLFYNEASKHLIRTLRTEIPQTAEIIIVESESSAPEEIEGVTKISADLGRGSQIAAGFEATQAPWVLIAHADALPPKGFFQAIKDAAESAPDCSLIVCGQRFDKLTWGTLIVTALNEIRAVFGGVAFGDQAMVIRHEAINAAGGFPSQPLMEDVEASLRLSCQGRVLYLGQEWTVSAKKWQMKFIQRFTMVFRLVATYQIARLGGSKKATEISEKMYAEYYPEHAKKHEHLR